MTVGTEYAKAMYSLAESEGVTELLLDELRTVKSVLEQNPTYIKLLSTPSLKKEEKNALIDRAFSSLREYTVNMLKLLCEARAVTAVHEILTEYEALYDEANGIVRVDVITAVPMSKEQESALAEKLSVTLGAKIILSPSVDRSILGGVILRYGGTQTDASIKARLDSISAGIRNTIV